MHRGESSGAGAAKATAVAGANIALVKYWGRRDDALNLPLTGSVSLTLDALSTRTTVAFDPALRTDSLFIDGVARAGRALDRVSAHLDRIRERAKVSTRARVASVNSMSEGAGLASSASAFAALTAAAYAALGLPAKPEELSAVARLGSGSACRSIHGGFVEWLADAAGGGSYAVPLAPPEHMPLHDVALVFSGETKEVGSAQGHGLAATSPLNAARVAEVGRLLPRVRAAIASRDLRGIGEVAEADALLMHSVMMTSTPALLYWRPATVAGMLAVRRWRSEGLEAYFTIDAGPNLHVLCLDRDAPEVARRAREELGLPPDRILDSAPGPGVRLVDEPLF